MLDTTSDNKDLPRFVTKKWIEVYDQSEKNYSINKEIRIKTSMLRLDLCDYSNAYIIVKGDITVTNPNNAKGNEAVAFTNNAPFINCISKINGIKNDNAEDLDVVMSMCVTYLNTLRIIRKQQVVYGIIIGIKQLILFQLSLNLSNIRQVLQELLIMLAMMMIIMMQIMLVKMKLKL